MGDLDDDETTLCGECVFYTCLPLFLCYNFCVIEGPGACCRSFCDGCGTVARCPCALVEAVSGGPADDAGAPPVATMDGAGAGDAYQQNSWTDVPLGPE